MPAEPWWLNKNKMNNEGGKLPVNSAKTSDRKEGRGGGRGDTHPV